MFKLFEMVLVNEMFKKNYLSDNNSKSSSSDISPAKYLSVISRTLVSSKTKIGFTLFFFDQSFFYPH